MKIDFIVPIKIDDNYRLKLFNQTMQTLFENTPVKYVNQIIIVDDCSKLNGSNYGAYVYRNEKQLGVGGSKNKGIQIAESTKGDFIYLFDADVYFTKNWLEKILEAYNKYNFEFPLIGGGVHPYLKPREGEGNYLLNSYDAVSGWSWFLSWDTFYKYGKLNDNSLGVGKSEDWEYCQRIRNNNKKVGVLKKQVVAHCGLMNSEAQSIVGYHESRDLVQQIAPKAFI